MHLPSHKSHEFGKVDRVVSIGINLIVIQSQISSQTCLLQTPLPTATTKTRPEYSFEEGPKTHLVDHVFKLSLSRVLAERSHNGTELLGSDSSISVCGRP